MVSGTRELALRASACIAKYIAQTSPVLFPQPQLTRTVLLTVPRIDITSAIMVANGSSKKSGLAYIQKERTPFKGVLSIKKWR